MQCCAALLRVGADRFHTVFYKLWGKNASSAGGEVQVPHIHSIVCHEESEPGFSDDASAIAAPFLTDAAGTTKHSREFPAVPVC